MLALQFCVTDAAKAHVQLCKLTSDYNPKSFGLCPSYSLLAKWQPPPSPTLSQKFDALVVLFQRHINHTCKSQNY